MRMIERENFAQYYGQVKEIVNAIRGAGGIINDDIVISKVLRTLLPIYAIRVSTVRELRCTLGNKLTQSPLKPLNSWFNVNQYKSLFGTLIIKDPLVPIVLPLYFLVLGSISNLQ